MIYATKTLDSIALAINKDGGARFRHFLGKVVPHMADAFRSKEEGFRQHLGASQIGKNCARAIWYGFRWVGVDPIVFDPDDMEEVVKRSRMQRLFNRGHLEEARFIAMLLMVGAKVIQQRDGKQLRFQSADGHFAGSMDGIVVGLPDAAPGEQWLNEYKTVNDARFKKLQKDGLREWEPTYYAQIQTYLRAFNIKYCLFFAVNKNDDDLYAEVIVANPEQGRQYADRAQTIIYADTPPMRTARAGLGNTECKWCDFKKLCLPVRGEFRDVAVNCRTCQWSRPQEQVNEETGEPQWYCDHRRCNLDKAAQLAACPSYSQINNL